MVGDRRILNFLYQAAACNTSIMMPACFAKSLCGYMPQIAHYQGKLTACQAVYRLNAVNFNRCALILQHSWTIAEKMVQSNR
ncbi:MAG: hypothetical protein JXR80_05110 [Deltaproteobacteria bacterium]|nr:hypothetical protein [Deltaproteobacteria bacterium]